MEREKAAKEEILTLGELENGKEFYVVLADGTIGSRLVYERVTGNPKATAKRTDTEAMRQFPPDTTVVRVSRGASKTLSAGEKSASALPRPYESP